MIEYRLREVAAVVGGEVADADAHRRVDQVTIDSRTASPGALFVALPGQRRHGVEFVVDAAARGATGYLAPHPVDGVPGAVVVAEPLQALQRLAGDVRRRATCAVVAITGSVGKTTTKDLTAAALGAARRVVSAPASYNNEIGVPLTLCAIGADTDVAVVEIGTRARGDIAALVPVARPDVGVVTAVAAAHTETLGDLDGVARAKAELIEGLPATGLAVLNADDPRVAAMAARTDARVLRVGTAADADVRVAVTAVGADGRARVRVDTPWGAAHLTVPVPGRHHAANAAMAVAVAAALGIEPTVAAGGVEQAQVSRWRCQLEEVGGVLVINDAYNANPASVRAALELLRDVGGHRHGRRWAVLGEMAELGEVAADAHAAVGRACGGIVDRLVVVAGPHTDALTDAAQAAGVPVTTVPDAAGALEVLRGEVRPGDVVLVKASRVVGLERVAEGLAAVAR